MSLIVSLENYKMSINDKSDLGGSDMSEGLLVTEDIVDNSIIADYPFLCKETAMSNNRFIKFIPSEEAMWLLKNKGHAFRLLAIVAESARRYEGGPDGLEIGEAFIGPHQNYDMSERNYRTAKEILVNRRHLKIVETNRTRKKSTTGTTTASTKVKLLSSNVWDINLNIDDDRNDDRPTTDRRLTDDKQEDKEVKESKEKKAFINEGISPIAPKGDIAIEEPSKKVFPKRKPKAEKIERQPFVRTTDVQHKSLIDQHGDVMVSMFYKKLSEWKIGKGVGDRPNDYLAITKWVIQAVNNELQAPSSAIPETNWGKNQQFIQEVMDNFPEKTQGMYFFYKTKVLRHKGYNFDLSGEMPHEDFTRLVCQHLKISMEIVNE